MTKHVAEGDSRAHGHPGGAPLGTSPRSRRKDGSPHQRYNRFKFWILTALEAHEELAPLHVADWFEKHVARADLGADAFHLLERNVTERCRQMATAYRRPYLLRRMALVQFPGEAMPRARYKYRLSAYGRSILRKMRDGDLPGAPPEFVVHGGALLRQA